MLLHPVRLDSSSAWFSGEKTALFDVLCNEAAGLHLNRKGARLTGHVGLSASQQPHLHLMPLEACQAAIPFSFTDWHPDVRTCLFLTRC